MFNILTKTSLCWILFALVIFSITACSSVERRYQTQAINQYLPAGWIKYNEASQAQKDKKYSGYKLVQNALEIDEGLQEVLNYYGQPDFVKAKSKRILNLAYLQKGIVLSFHINSDTAPTVYGYAEYNDLSQQLVRLFKNSNQAAD